MDKKKDCIVPECGKVPDLSQRQIVVGSKQLKKALEKGRAEYVYLAENADPALTQPLAELCGDNQIQIAWVPTMEALGSACGIEVGAAAAAVLL